MMTRIHCACSSSRPLLKGHLKAATSRKALRPSFGKDAPGLFGVDYRPPQEVWNRGAFALAKGDLSAKRTSIAGADGIHLEARLDGTGAVFSWSSSARTPGRQEGTRRLYDACARAHNRGVILLLDLKRRGL